MNVKPDTQKEQSKTIGHESQRKECKTAKRRARLRMAVRPTTQSPMNQ